MSCTLAGRLSLSIVCLLFIASPAGAIPITWNLSGVFFGNGSAATGSFVFDADVNVYSDMFITTDRASYETADLWEDSPAGGERAESLALVEGLGANDLNGKPTLWLDWSGALLMPVAPCLSLLSRAMPPVTSRALVEARTVSPSAALAIR